jgi:hypothetical protein
MLRQLGHHRLSIRCLGRLVLGIVLPLVVGFGVSCFDSNLASKEKVGLGPI